MIQNFLASGTWKANFKSRNNIVSRKVTKTVTKQEHQNAEKIEETAFDFVQSIIGMINEAKYNPDQVFNCDQSGFLCELHSGRSLEFCGSKDVLNRIQSKSATTHSYTLLPIITASGELLSPLFVQIQQPGGHFPAKFKHENEDNIFPLPGSSHIMTKNAAFIWVEHVLTPAAISKGSNVLVLVDSWTCWNASKQPNDPNCITKKIPEGVNIRFAQIPPKCTLLIQPEDRYFFRFPYIFIFMSNLHFTGFGNL